VLGFIEGLWQLPIALAGREPPLPYFLGVTGAFTILVWIFNSTGGSLVMALLYHASLNVAAGSLQFDPGDLVAPLLTWLAVALLVLGYGARNLARQQRFTWEHRPARKLLAAWPTPGQGGDQLPRVRSRRGSAGRCRDRRSGNAVGQQVITHAQWPIEQALDGTRPRLSERARGQTRPH
jgi:membrane-bound metal-dependent hydrolase YbcI (DUF457 family)